jgi:hypothetical protein
VNPCLWQVEIWFIYIDDLDPDNMECIIINLGEKEHSDIV